MARSDRERRSRPDPGATTSSPTGFGAWYPARVNASDTAPEIERILIEGDRRMSPAEKLARVREMTLAVQQLALAGIRRRHPAISDDEARLRLAALWLDRATMVRVFGWDPDLRGRG